MAIRRALLPRPRPQSLVARDAAASTAARRRARAGGTRMRRGDCRRSSRAQCQHVAEPVYKLRERRGDWRAVDEEVIALDLARAESLAINRSGAELWPLLIEGTARTDLVRRLKETFGLDEAQANRDLDAFVESLQSRQLLEVED